ncbi:DUF4019 domain-containing protein [Lentimicrobium sp. S6]|uniref:DUF4019 domain-containing protein n=1 Tax=Lentimicrobium sp. S6 TaxID=2735872 RepID=UPI0015562D3C|nr:DUF4019 domain-containing protein [Lentimicrobium sp. S6]NPD48326.1 DUF4019 domain-containing protein [Lentimicrobium sp. S6]
MRKILLILTSIILITSCKTNKTNKNEFGILLIDDFETKDKNVELCNDLENYLFIDMIRVDLPNLSDEILGNLRWQRFLVSEQSTKEDDVHFRFIISNEARKERDLLFDYFTNKVDEICKFHHDNDSLFQEIVILSDKLIDNIVSGDIDSIWTMTGETMRSYVTKSQFEDYIKQIGNLEKLGGKRSFKSKHHYTYLDQIGKGDFYVINYGFDNDKGMLEQLNYQMVDDKIELLGYIVAIPNNATQQ